MLNKIVSIKNVGRFKDYSASGDVTLKRLTLFFGPNGRGKSTLCEVLRSLQTDRPEIINGRRTLTSVDSPSIQLRTSAAMHTFKNAAWTAPFADVSIFDATFVCANVYSGETVSLDNKRNLYRVIVGERGVQLAREVEELDESLRASAKRVTAAKAAVERIKPTGVSLQDFVKLSPVDDIDIRVTKARKQVSTLEKSAEIKDKAILKALPIFNLPNEFRSILATTLPDVSATATALVETHVTEHTKGATSDWLATGLAFIKDSGCPFCGLPNSASELFAAYNTVFSDGFSKLRAEVISLQSKLRSINSGDIETLINETQRANAALAEYWRQFLQIELPGIDVSAFVGVLLPLLTASSEMLDRKLADPLQLVIPNAEFETILAAFNDAAASFTTYNEAIARANASVQAKKTEVDAASLAQHRDELANLESAQIRYGEEAITACNEYSAATTEREGLENRKKKAKADLDEYSESIFGKYQDRINILLGKFGAGFRIQNAVRNYSGGTPSTSYHIVIDDVAVDVGDNKSPVDTPSFRNTLSAGDKSALAFAFFVARIELDGGCGHNVLVFDDPFTSQDRSRRACTQQVICKLAGDAAQVIVFSHDQSFLRSVWDGATDRNDRKPLQLRRMGRDTIITEWDIEHETKPNYLQQHALLKEYVTDGKAKPEQVAKTIRPLMEEYLRLTFPNQFSSTEWLGDFIRKIREADDSSILKTAQGHLSEIEDINDFSKGFHHSGDIEIDDMELASYCARVLDLVEGF